MHAAFTDHSKLHGCLHAAGLLMLVHVEFTVVILSLVSFLVTGLGRMVRLERSISTA